METDGSQQNYIVLTNFLDQVLCLETIVQLSFNKCPQFYGLRTFLPCPKESLTCPYSETNKYIPLPSSPVSLR